MASTYPFGAIRPKAGKAAGLVLPHCNTAAMSLQLADVAAAVAPNAKRRSRLVLEHQRRQGDPSEDGSTRPPIPTAYRQGT